MGTKQRPGRFDCHAGALPDEPMFTLLARDPDFARLVRKWTKRHERDVSCGVQPGSDMGMVNEALELAEEGTRWRWNNMGRWREKPP